MKKIRLTDAIENQQIVFAFGGDRRVTVTHQASEVSVKDAEAIEAQFPGWTEGVAATPKAGGNQAPNQANPNGTA